MFKSKGISLILLGALFGACAQQVHAPGEESLPQNVGSTIVSPVAESQGGGAPLAQGIEAEIITPRNQHAWYEFNASFPRQVDSKTLTLRDFSRTLEKTELKIRLNLDTRVFGNSEIKLVLFHSGSQEDVKNLPASVRSGKVQVDMEFKTPKLSDEERQTGYTKVSYDVFVDQDGKRSHLPFSFLIFDESSPALVTSKSKSDCLIYHQPERASGCYQNRTRTTQEVIFNDSVLKHHEVDVSFNGSVSIAPSIVTIQLGGGLTEANGTDVSRGSEIHFTNCIECASVIYRQEVETLRTGDIFQVMADGSATWMGSTQLRETHVAYEFASTPSESQNYNCDISSQLPVGDSPACGKP